MSPCQPTEYEQLTPEDAAQIDAVCDRFEQAWRETKNGGTVPRIESYVGQGTGSGREALIGELIALEQACRERYGFTVQPEDSKELDAEAEAQALPPTHRIRGVTDVPADRPTGRPSIPGLELVSVLGSGGMGVVYKARQATLHRDVAVKFLRDAHRGDSEQRERFLQEARAVARLRHPNLVQLYEFGEVPVAGGAGSQPYLVLEYVSGGSLAELLRGLPQPPDVAARLVEALADAIHYAHQQGVIHRDLKPANILLQRAGVKGDEPTRVLGEPRHSPSPPLTADLCVKITDFGLAKFLTGGDLTQSGYLLGTPSYIAPEQLSKSERLTAAVDVYGLGAILYEALSGRPPFAGATVEETLYQVRQDEPVPPRRLQPTVPRDLETICLKCLRKESGRRYATAGDLADDLRRFQVGEPIRARPVGTGERIVRWCRRQPAVAALLASVILLVLFVAVGSPLAAFWWRRQRDEARQNASRAEDALWQSYLSEAQLRRSAKQSGQRFHGLELLSKASSIHRSPAVRDAAIACLASPDLKIVRQWKWTMSKDFVVALDSPLERYAYRDDRLSDINVRSLADDRLLATLPGPQTAAWADNMRFSPDGQYFAALYTFPEKDKRPCEVYVWDLSQRTILLRKPGAKSGASLDFSPDGGRIAIADTDDSIGIFAVARGRELSRLRKSCRLRGLAFDPTGRRLAVSSLEDRVVEIRDLDNEGRVATKFTHPSGVYISAWRGDGKLLATGCDDRNGYVWDVSANRQLAALTGHKRAVTSVAFNRAGDLLATASWDNTTKLWDAVGGVNLLTVHGFCRNFDRDDEHLAYIDGPELGIWQVAGRRECRTLHFGGVGRPAPEVDTGGPWSVDFNSDGRLLAAAGKDGVRLWDMPAGREVAHLTCGHSESALFPPGETSLITYGQHGLQRWPIQRDHQRRSDFSLGRPVLLRPTTQSVNYRAAMSRDGNTIAYLDYANQQTVVIDAGTPGKQVVLKGTPHEWDVELSPTARWAAVGDWEGREGARVWDLTRGEQVWQLPPTDLPSTSCRVAFSPDGQWLVASEQAKYRFWQVGSWTPGWEISRDRSEPTPGPLAFSRDSRMLAIARSAWTVQLIDPATRQEIATLSAPDPQHINSLCFSPDAGQLAAATNNHTIQLWDLQLIRQQLAEMNLDWEVSMSR